MTGPPTAPTHRKPPGPSLRSDGGAAGIETAIAVTAFLLATFLAVGGLRITAARSDVSASARAGARAAAQAYGPGDAQVQARAVVADALASRDVSCAGLEVDIGGRHAPGDIVTATVRCRVDLSDVALVGFPGQVEVESTAAEMVDIVRGGGS